MRSLVIGAGGNTNCLRLGFALVWPNSSIAAARRTTMLSTLEMGIELAFVVIEDEESSCMMRLSDHPREVTLLTTFRECAFDDIDHFCTIGNIGLIRLVCPGMAELDAASM